MWKWLYIMASPKSFYNISKKIQSWTWIICAALLCYGLVSGLFLVPADYQQGDAFRIIYIHVPAAFLSLSIYGFMAFCALLTLVWRIKMADIMLSVSAPIGAWITLLALATGSIWGKPMWGTWWIWDARLTSELILLFLYIGVLAFSQAIADQQKRAKILAVIVLIGFIDIPIIHYSVYWWNTLHQGSTIRVMSPSAIAPEMLYPLLAMIVGFMLSFALIAMARARTELLNREKNAAWVKVLLQQIEEKSECKQ